MEPRNKINKELSSKEYFLQNNLVEYEQPNIYSLEEEFAKAKKNRDVKPYLIFFGFILLLIIATIVVTNYLEDKSKKINIDIEEFEDSRFKETLNTAKEKDRQLDRTTEELDNKAKELANKTGEIKKMQSSFNNELQKVKEELQQQTDIENTDKKSIQRLERKSQQQLDKIKKNYETLINNKQLEIAGLQEQVKSCENKIRELKLYQYGLSSFLKEKKAIGCIVDPRQRKNIIIYTTKDLKLTSETIVDLYRNDNEYIGQLKLIPDINGIRGELVGNVKVKPFDWFGKTGNQ
jgi:uncharacterized phage infection (PIP) family protein YhgE